MIMEKSYPSSNYIYFCLLSIKFKISKKKILMRPVLSHVAKPPVGKNFKQTNSALSTLNSQIALSDNSVHNLIFPSSEQLINSLFSHT
ncbi:hypothetical protein BpHYR1_006361 [Brachionus plicatilis]|uniref:Uncharacterized protein n=1 Tax=Brachionus plicatilis TaxID=10195 RepID=A0A3M7SAC2_BRAPC|nr:hypothetical protein BpHYR1_006361 [Brachionus plicatilis]